jgi:hypothetical protein
MKYPPNRIQLIRQPVLLFLTLATLMILAVGSGSQYAQNKRSIRLVAVTQQRLSDITDTGQKELVIDLHKPQLLDSHQNIDFDDTGARLSRGMTGLKGTLESEGLEIPGQLHSAVLIWSGTPGISNSAFVNGYLRTSEDGTAWEPWTLVQATESDSVSPTTFESNHLQLPAQTRYVQFRIEFQSSGATNTPLMDQIRLVYFIRDDAVETSFELSNTLIKQNPGSQAAAVQGVSAPRIITRTEWGCPDGESAPNWEPVPDHTDNIPITHLVVHHTRLGQRDPFRPNDYKLWVQKIYNEHKYYYPDSRDPFGDIGYNLLIDPKGNIYEGRAGGVDEKGAHFSCYNSHTTGIALLGDFTSAPPTKQALDALRQVLAWRATVWRIDPTIKTILISPDTTRPLREIYNISGHKDLDPITWGCGDSDRTCPGDSLYFLLAGIRSDVSTIVPPGFSIQVQPAYRSLIVVQGQQTDIGLTLDTFGGLSGTAAISVSGLPAGMSVAPISVQLPVNGIASATLVLKTTMTTPTGLFSPTITASLAGQQKSVRFNVTVTGAPGSVSVKALYNGVPWSGSVDYTILGPQGPIIGLSVPGSTSSLPPGQYSLVYNQGGPGKFSSITPAATQTLVSGGQLTFTLNFSLSVSPLIVTCTASPSTVTTGQSSTFSASASGGVGPYLFTWTGAVSGTGPSISKVFNTAGTFAATVTASDGSLQNKQATCSVQVNPAVLPTFDAYTFTSAKTVQAGQSVTYDIYFVPQSGFSGSVALSVSGLPAGASRTSSSTINLSGTSTIPYALTIQTSTSTPVGTFPLVFMANGLGITRTINLTLTTTAPPSQPLSASCNIVPNPISLGSGATVYAQATGGVSPFVYIINGVNMGNVSSLLVMPSAVGTFTVPVTIRDSQSHQASSSCSAQVVAADPYVTGFNYTPNPAKATQIVTLNIYGGNFGSTTEVWFVGPSCSAPGCRTTAVTVSGTAYINAQAVLNLTGTYTVNIRNGSGVWVKAGTVTVVQ